MCCSTSHPRGAMVPWNCSSWCMWFSYKHDWEDLIVYARVKYRRRQSNHVDEACDLSLLHRGPLSPKLKTILPPILLNIYSLEDTVHAFIRIFTRSKYLTVPKLMFRILVRARISINKTVWQTLRIWDKLGFGFRSNARVAQSLQQH